MAVPEESLAHRHRQLHIDVSLGASLLLVVIAGNVGVERNVGGEVVEAPVFEEFCALFLALDAGKRLERLHVGGVGVLETAAVVAGVFIHVIGVGEALLVAGVAEREVAGVPRFGHLADNVEFKSGDTETLHGAHLGGKRHDAVALVLSLAEVESIVEFDVLVERVVFRSYFFARVGVVDRRFEFHLLGEEATEVGLHGKVVFVELVGAAVGEALVHRAETGGLAVGTEIESGDVADCEVEVPLGSPAAALVEIGYAQFVNPHCSVACNARFVAHTDENHPHIAERRVTYHAHLVGGVLGVVSRIHRVEGDGGAIGTLGGVALKFDIGKHACGAVEHIGFGPHYILVGGAVGVVFPRGCNREGDFILVVVLLDVATEANKHRKVAVFEGTFLVDERFNVGKHLQALVEAQVELGVAIHSAGVAGFEVAHLERERLLVELGGLSLPGIDDSGYSRRKHIVDRLCAVVLLDIHRTDVERAFSRSVGAAVEVVLICAPFAPHEFEGGKAQVGCLFEAGHEHAHKADGREVVD